MQGLQVCPIARLELRDDVHEDPAVGVIKNSQIVGDLPPFISDPKLGVVANVAINAQQCTCVGAVGFLGVKAADFTQHVLFVNYVPIRPQHSQMSRGTGEDIAAARRDQRRTIAVFRPKGQRFVQVVRQVGAKDMAALL